jgi:hypothetical protein
VWQREQKGWVARSSLPHLTCQQAIRYLHTQDIGEEEEEKERERESDNVKKLRGETKKKVERMGCRVSGHVTRRLQPCPHNSSAQHVAQAGWLVGLLDRGRGRFGLKRPCHVVLKPEACVQQAASEKAHSAERATTLPSWSDDNEALASGVLSCCNVAWRRANGSLAKRMDSCQSQLDNAFCLARPSRMVGCLSVGCRCSLLLGGS